MLYCEQRWNVDNRTACFQPLFMMSIYVHDIGHRIARRVSSARVSNTRSKYQNAANRLQPIGL